LRNLRLILHLHYYLGTHILGASRGGPCDSTALVKQSLQPVFFSDMINVLHKALTVMDTEEGLYQLFRRQSG